MTGKLPSGFRDILKFAAVSFSLSLAGCASDGPVAIDQQPVEASKPAEVSKSAEASSGAVPGSLSKAMRAKARAAMKPTAVSEASRVSDSLSLQQKANALVKSSSSAISVAGSDPGALQVADSDDAKAQAQIDRAMLAQRSGLATQQVEPATHRSEGSGLIASTQRSGVPLQPVERLGLQPASEMPREEMLRRLHELSLKAHAAAVKVEAAETVQPYGSLALATPGVKEK